jgi:hypothetical protein
MSNITQSCIIVSSLNLIPISLGKMGRIVPQLPKYRSDATYIPIYDVWLILPHSPIHPQDHIGLQIIAGDTPQYTITYP